MKIIISERQYKFLLKESSSESILFVGDSHSVDLPFTYTGMFKNIKDNVKIIAVGGKRTSWMKEQLSKELSNNHYDKVVIWGGNNDMYSQVAVNQAIFNIQDMVNMVNKQGGKAYVIVGYDQKSFTIPHGEFFKKHPEKQKYPVKVYDDLREKYIQFQKELPSSISGAVIIPAFNLDNSYTKDNVHGNSAAQKEVFSVVSRYLNKDITLTTKNDDDGEKKFTDNVVLNNLIKYQKEGKTFEKHGGKKIPYQKEVEDIQTALQFIKCSLPVWGVDGKFGSETKKATICFQNKVGLEPTGIIGLRELDKLISFLIDKDFSKEDLGSIKKIKVKSIDQL